MSFLECAAVGDHAGQESNDRLIGGITRPANFLSVPSVSGFENNRIAIFAGLFLLDNCNSRHGTSLADLWVNALRHDMYQPPLRFRVWPVT